MFCQNQEAVKLKLVADAQPYQAKTNPSKLIELKSKYKRCGSLYPGGDQGEERHCGHPHAVVQRLPDPIWFQRSRFPGMEPKACPRAFKSGGGKQLLRIDCT